MIRLLTCVFILLNALSAFPQQIDWKRDIRTLKRELPKRHVKPFVAYSQKQFNAALDSLIVLSEKLTDAQMRISLQRVIARLGDAHTCIVTANGYGALRYFPFSLYQFKDGCFVLETDSANRDLLGCRLDSMNHFPVKVVMDSMMNLLPADTSPYAGVYSLKYLSYLDELKYFGVVGEDEQLLLSLVDRSGRRIERVLSPITYRDSNIVYLQQDSMNFIQQHRRDWFGAEWREQDSMLYIYYNRCYSRELAAMYGRNLEHLAEMPSFLAFSDDVLKMAGKYPVRKLVMDLRWNQGGGTPQGNELIRRMSEDPVLKNVPSYVVIGRLTFSAAVQNASQMHRLMHAKFVGETASGKPAHFGNVAQFKLPASGLVLRYSLKYMNWSVGPVNLLTPDYPTDISFSDYLSGHDAAYEIIRSLKQ